MITEIDLAPEEIEFLSRHTRQSDPSLALRAATNEYIRYRKRMNLVESEVEVEFDPEIVEAMHRAEKEGE